MARQKGVIKLEGAVGDISFYKTKDGYMVRERAGITSDRIKKDPAFQRTRENNAEFGRAGRAGKLLRNAMNMLLQYASDGRVASRLTTEMLKVVQSDVVNKRGERTVQEGAIDLLVGFDFNANGPLLASLFAPYVTAIDRAGGNATVDFPNFIPHDAIVYPEAASHFRLVIGAAEVDFPNGTFSFTKDETVPMLLDQTPTGNLTLSASVPAASTLDLFLILGIDFMQEVNGTMYPLKNGSHNPLTLVAIHRV